MMFDKLKFKSLVVLRGLTMQQVASMIDIDITTLYRKMNGESDFFRKEIDILCKGLNIDNPQEIFFASDITKT